jgi:putative addiction module component (TIGR02574 family)
MSATREEVLKSAMELSETDRLLLATELMETVSDDLPGWSIDDPAFAAELERRAADGTKAIPWDEVQAQLRADLQS